MLRRNEARFCGTLCFGVKVLLLLPLLTVAAALLLLLLILILPAQTCARPKVTLPRARDIARAIFILGFTRVNVGGSLCVS